jgi:hypothetical protein
MEILPAHATKARREVTVQSAETQPPSKPFKKFKLFKTFEDGLNRLNVLNDLNTALAVNPNKRKHLRRIEDAVERHQIVIGVLEADVARAVVDRLNTAKIK